MMVSLNFIVNYKIKDNIFREKKEREKTYLF